ncbi:Uncharacterised protein [Vibrio cholerae]|nr:Uncharacterised protein [Vibrio cholerae]CSI09642.1 Uncharacterised protein [Vibrio cholerae]CSI49553.1 Uncharacterised protein [Vibrio cholerae]
MKTMNGKGHFGALCYCLLLRVRYKMTVLLP